VRLVAHNKKRGEILQKHMGGDNPPVRLNKSRSRKEKIEIKLRKKHGVDSLNMSGGRV
jgi:hypothetical protein